MSVTLIRPSRTRALLRVAVALVCAGTLLTLPVGPLPARAAEAAATATLTRPAVSPGSSAVAPVNPGTPASPSTAAGVASSTTAAGTPGCLLRDHGWRTPVEKLPHSVLQPVVVPGDHEFTDRDGVTSTYHVSTRGVDFTCPWGVMFWFEGDQEGHPRTSIADSTRLGDLARVAARANLVLVAPDTPDTSEPMRATWWEDYQGNGTWFRALAASLVGTWHADPADLWFTGYSGGAEFITSEVLARHQQWIRGGGAVMIGGGETSGVHDDPSRAVRGMPLTWFVGSEDGEVDSEEWSPMDVAPDAQQVYSRAGFTDASLQVVPGVGHTGYDVAALVTKALEAAGRIY